MLHMEFTFIFLLNGKQQFKRTQLKKQLQSKNSVTALKLNGF